MTLPPVKLTRGIDSRRRAVLNGAGPAEFDPAQGDRWEQGDHLLATYADTRDRRLRDDLAAHYDRFAVGLARRFSTRRECLDDLAQVARVGLLCAIDRFDPRRGRPFRAFATVTIEGELKRHLRDRTWRMHVPRSLQENYLEVIKSVDALTQELGRSPGVEDVARRTDLTEERILEAMEVAASHHPRSLDAPSSDAPASLWDRAAGESSFAKVEERALLRTLGRRLPQHERHILKLRFVDELSQSEIAARIGVSQMYISRLLTRTLARMRRWAEAD